MPGIDVLGYLGAGQWTAADRDGILRAIQRARIDHCVIASSLAYHAEMEAGNAQVKAQIDQAPNLAGWVVVNPIYPERSSQEMRKYLGSRNFVGIILTAPTAGRALASDATREIVNAFRRYSKPVMAPCYNGTDVRDLEILAKEMPNLRFISGGAGGPAWQACLATAKRAVNIILEPCSGGYERGKLEAMVEVIGAHRILFGSGFPAGNPGAAFGLLAESGLSEADRQMILTGNAQKLLGIGRPAPAAPAADPAE